MLWKQEYKTIIADLVNPPSLKGSSLIGADFEFTQPQVLIMGWDFEGIASWEIWWKLLEDSFPACPNICMGFITGTAERKHLTVLDQCIPVSRHRRTFLWSDPHADWLRWSRFSEDRRVLATLIRPDGSCLVMQGLPTEDAWERFESEFQLALSHASDVSRV
ncbi:MAG: hypothetical protein K8R88_02370 [Armatimonadetes bacterium]|nr:hypothetical protein [Armatimonadota bacterium]